jgi:hypothetical protein
MEAVATNVVPDALTTPQVAALFGAAEWTPRSAIRRGHVRPPGKVGRLLLRRRADLERVCQGLVAAGYEPAETAAATEAPADG